MKRSKLLIIAASMLLVQLHAQTPDPEMAEKLKMVMALFDKNQQSLKDEITELNSSNEALTEANLDLYQDLQAAEKQIEDLRSEIETLRSQLAEASVQGIESTALQTTEVAVATETTVDSNEQAGSTSRVTPASLLSESPSTTPTLINVNTASLEELITLPLIDEAMAEQIISNRPYNNLEDLIVNQHFGPMKLRRITPFVTIE